MKFLHPALALFFTLLALAATAAESPRLTDPAFDAVWSETDFDRIAVGDHGLKKTLATFARDRLMTITPEHLREGENDITLLLTLVAEPGAMADLRLPIEGDALIPLLEASGVEHEGRSLRLGQCVRFNAEGEIAGEGPALAVAFGVPMARGEDGQLLYREGTPEHQAAMRLLSRVTSVVDLRDDFRTFPHPVDLHGAWANFAEAEAMTEEVPEIDALRRDMAVLMVALGNDAPEEARAAAGSLAQGLRGLPNYPSDAHLAIDYHYTTKRPYFWASLAYVAAAMLFLISLLGQSQRWWCAAMAVMIAGFTLHVLGAVARGLLIDRVPLSNLYEATTTGLAFVILVAIVLELFYRMKVVGLMSALLSFLYYRWLLTSQQFGNDAIEPLRAVLNSYWLDYHVTAMILSYGAFTVAFGMAVLYLLRVHFPRVMGWAPQAAQLDLYNHRAIQIGWPILAIGIVLGGIWADTAWGRMWSWDPKETWALITWLVYTVYMHLRLVHGFSGRIMAWASVGGYGCVLFTYLGVNTVLSGLHSYASNDDVVATTINPLTLMLWVVLFIVLLVVGVIIASLAMKKQTTHREIPATVP